MLTLKSRRLSHLLLLVITAVWALAPGSLPMLAANRPPETRIPLESLGYVAFSSPVLSSGASILTLHYVDTRHLLVTFSVRRLLKRIPDDPPQDTDRSIDAVLLEIPSGNILARTSWRMHDPAQYLWSLGDGRFLLRIRDRLTTIAPLANLKSGDPFKERPLLASPRPIGAVLLSPDSSLLILEAFDHLSAAEPERSPSPGTRAYAAAQAAAQANAQAAAQANAQAAAQPASSSTTPAGAQAQAKPVQPVVKPSSRIPVQIHFYRLRTNAEGDLYAQASGALGARTLVSIPADGSGFISVLDEGRQHWAFNFNIYRGKVEELSPFDSTCHPSPILVSRSEFIAFGCRSGNQRQMFGGFNLRGEEMWEQAIPENYLNPTFAFAPTAGRFAFGRVTTALAVGDPTATLTSDQYSSELVTVYQTDSGRQIFRFECTPILPAGQNFALSPDGADLAVIRDAAIEIHHLPALSPKDRAGIAKAASLAPELSDGPVLLSAPLSNASARAATSAGDPVATPPTDRASGRPSTIVDSNTVVPTATGSEANTSPDAATASATKPADTPAPTPAPAAPVQPTVQVIQNGDAQPQTDIPRKRPTLYNPGEHPDPSSDNPKEH